MSNTVTVPRVQTEDKDINQLQSNIITALQPLGLELNQAISAISSNPVQGGQIISSLLSAIPTKISQNLGKVPKGWILTDIDAAAEVFRTSWDVNSITLTASANCSVSILVF